MAERRTIRDVIDQADEICAGYALGPPEPTPPGELLGRRLRWEREHPRPAALVHAERMIVQGLNAYGFGRQYQVTRDDGFEIAVDDLLIRVEVSPAPGSGEKGRGE